MKVKKNKETEKEMVSKEELDLVRNQLVRALADYDNLKKRVEAEQTTFMDVAKVRLVTRFLPIFDMFEQVQTHVNDSGMAIALGELREKLSDEGISEITAKEGDEFDEALMAAVEVVEKPEMAGKVSSLSLKGYRMGDNILRYAKVVVCG